MMALWRDGRDCGVSGAREPGSHPPGRRTGAEARAAAGREGGSPVFEERPSLPCCASCASHLVPRLRLHADSGRDRSIWQLPETGHASGAQGLLAEPARCASVFMLFDRDLRLEPARKASGVRAKAEPSNLEGALPCADRGSAATGGRGIGGRLVHDRDPGLANLCIPLAAIVSRCNPAMAGRFERGAVAIAGDIVAPIGHMFAGRPVLGVTIWFSRKDLAVDIDSECPADGVRAANFHLEAVVWPRLASPSWKKLP